MFLRRVAKPPPQRGEEVSSAATTTTNWQRALRGVRAILSANHSSSSTMTPLEARSSSGTSRPFHHTQKDLPPALGRTRGLPQGGLEGAAVGVAWSTVLEVCPDEASKAAAERVLNQLLQRPIQRDDGGGGRGANAQR